MNKTVREHIMNFYKVLNYNRLYINEIKELLRLYPENKYRDKLNVAVIKRRDLLYHRVGYSQEMPPRDVPNVLVLNFNANGRIITHPDAGEVLGSIVNFIRSVIRDCQAVN